MPFKFELENLFFKRDLMEFWLSHNNLDGIFKEEHEEYQRFYDQEIQDELSCEVLKYET